MTIGRWLAWGAVAALVLAALALAAFSPEPYVIEEALRWSGAN